MRCRERVTSLIFNLAQFGRPISNRFPMPRRCRQGSRPFGRGASCSMRASANSRGPEASSPSWAPASDVRVTGAGSLRRLSARGCTPAGCGGASRSQLRAAVTMLTLALASAVCGNGETEPPEEECDDGNLVDLDGCSRSCLSEKIHVMTWFNTSDCSGHVVKELVFNDREYTRSKNRNKPWLPGTCGGGLRQVPCRCTTGVPVCDDGGDPAACMCDIPRCETMMDWLPNCNVWTRGLSAGRQLSYKVTCQREIPRTTTDSTRSVSGAFSVVKHWRLTDSTDMVQLQKWLTDSTDMVQLPKVADTYAWENTRARAIAHGEWDYAEFFASRTCIPSFTVRL